MLAVHEHKFWAIVPSGYPQPTNQRVILVCHINVERRSHVLENLPSDVPTIIALDLLALPAPLGATYYFKCSRSDFRIDKAACGLDRPAIGVGVGRICSQEHADNRQRVTFGFPSLPTDPCDAASLHTRRADWAKACSA